MRTVTKVTAVLEYLGEAGEAGVSDVARHLGADKSVTHRILRTLCDTGWVAQNPASRRYLIGPALAVLVATLPSRADVIAAAIPVLLDLVAATDETAFLSVRQGPFNVVEVIRESSNEMRVVSEPGRRIPLHGGAAGKTLLAFERAAVSAGLIAEDLPALDPRMPLDPARLAAELDLIRSRGWSYDSGEHAPGICGLAAPILMLNGTLLGCVSLRAPSQRLPLALAQERAPLVVAAADRVRDTLWPASNASARR